MKIGLDNFGNTYLIDPFGKATAIDVKNEQIASIIEKHGIADAKYIYVDSETGKDREGRMFPFSSKQIENAATFCSMTTDEYKQSRTEMAMKIYLEDNLSRMKVEIEGNGKDKKGHLAERIENIKNDIVTYKQNITILEEKIKSLEAELDTKPPEEKRNMIENQILECKGAIATLDKEIQFAEARIEKIEQTIDGYKAAIAVIADPNTSIDQKVQALIDSEKDAVGKATGEPPYISVDEIESGKYVDAEAVLNGISEENSRQHELEQSVQETSDGKVAQMSGENMEQSTPKDETEQFGVQGQQITKFDMLEGSNKNELENNIQGKIISIATDGSIETKLKEKITDLEQKIDSIQLKIDGLKEQIEGIKSDLENRGKNPDDQISITTALNSVLDTRNKELEKATTELAEKKAELIGKKTELEQVRNWSELNVELRDSDGKMDNIIKELISNPIKYGLSDSDIERLGAAFPEIKDAVDKARANEIIEAIVSATEKKIDERIETLKATPELEIKGSSKQAQIRSYVEKIIDGVVPKSDSVKQIAQELRDLYKYKLEMTTEEKAKYLEANAEKFGLSAEDVKSLKVASGEAPAEAVEGAPVPDMEGTPKPQGVGAEDGDGHPKGQADAPDADDDQNPNEIVANEDPQPKISDWLDENGEKIGTCEETKEVDYETGKEITVEKYKDLDGNVEKTVTTKEMDDGSVEIKTYDGDSRDKSALTSEEIKQPDGSREITVYKIEQVNGENQPRVEYSSYDKNRQLEQASITIGPENNPIEETNIFRIGDSSAEYAFESYKIESESKDTDGNIITTSGKVSFDEAGNPNFHVEKIEIEKSDGSKEVVTPLDNGNTQHDFYDKDGNFDKDKSCVIDSNGNIIDDRNFFNKVLDISSWFNHDDPVTYDKDKLEARVEDLKESIVEIFGNNHIDVSDPDPVD